MFVTGFVFLFNIMIPALEPKSKLINFYINLI